MESLRHRILPVVALLVIAPVSAEYLQAYLPQTGDAFVMVAGLLVLGPLYGGAALLIREVAVRTGRGWTGRLLMAAAFGLLMTALVDGSLWQVDDPDISYWDDLRGGTLIDPAGFAVFPLLTWVTGHVVYSIGAPLALVDALAPAHRGRPLLGRPGLVVVASLWVGSALLIHADPGYDQTALSATRILLSLLAVIVLVALALSPLGRPVRRDDSARAAWTPALALLLAVVGLAAVDLLPYTWLGAALYAAALVAGGWWLLRVSRSPTWGLRHVTAIAVAAPVERTLLGFVSPLPADVGVGSKLVTSVVLLVLVSAVSAMAWRRARTMPDLHVSALAAFSSTRPGHQDRCGTDGAASAGK